MVQGRPIVKPVAPNSISLRRNVALFLAIRAVLLTHSSNERFEIVYELSSYVSLVCHGSRDKSEPPRYLVHLGWFNI